MIMNRSAALLSQDDMPVYTFPEDYIERLWQAIKAVDPDFSENLDAFMQEQTAQ